MAVPTSSAPYLSIIVPVYGRGDLVVELLASVERCLDRPELEVILSDDGSDQETLDVLRTFTGAVVVESEVNTGFAATCNRGAAVARGQMLLFLNSDARVAADFFTELAAARDAHPAAGVVGARILYPNGVVQEAGGAIGWGGVGQMLSYGKDPRSRAVSGLVSSTTSRVLRSRSAASTSSPSVASRSPTVAATSRTSICAWRFRTGWGSRPCWPEPPM